MKKSLRLSLLMTLVAMLAVGCGKNNSDDEGQNNTTVTPTTSAGTPVVQPGQQLTFEQFRSYVNSNSFSNVANYSYGYSTYESNYNCSGQVFQFCFGGNTEYGYFTASGAGGNLSYTGDVPSGLPSNDAQALSKVINIVNSASPYNAYVPYADRPTFVIVYVGSKQYGIDLSFPVGANPVMEWDGQSGYSINSGY